jgi:hypothetical protein
MAMSIAERRKKDRTRKARQRAASRAAGTPPPAAVLHAIAEAVAFAAAADVEHHPSGLAPTLELAVVVRTSRDILIKRCGYDRDRSIAALSKLLRPRPEHRWPGSIPSLAPIHAPASEAV